MKLGGLLGWLGCVAVVHACGSPNFQSEDQDGGSGGADDGGAGSKASGGAGARVNGASGEAGDDGSGGSMTASTGGKGGKAGSSSGGSDTTEGGEAGSSSSGATGDGGNGGTTGGTGSGGSGDSGGQGGTDHGGMGGSDASGGVGAGGAGGSTAGTGGGGTGGGGGSGGLAGSLNVGGMGTAGTGGTVACAANFSMANDGFVRMPAQPSGACWYGYAYGGGDSGSTVYFQGGGVSGTDFSEAMGIFRINGTVNAATETNSYAGLVFAGFNLNQLPGSAVKSTRPPLGSSITVICTGCTTPPMRVQLSAGSKRWCAPLTSGTPIPYSTFNTQRWDGGMGQGYAKEPIDQLQIVIPGGATAVGFDLSVSSVKED